MPFDQIIIQIYVQCVVLTAADVFEELLLESASPPKIFVVVPPENLLITCQISKEKN